MRRLGNLSVDNGAFSVAGFSETVNALAGTGTVDSGTGSPVLTIGNNDASGTFIGVLKQTAGTLSINKIGCRHSSPLAVHWTPSPERPP